MSDLVNPAGPVSDALSRTLQHPVFAGISAADVGKVIPYFEYLELKPGEIVIQEGLGNSQDIFLILTGEMEVTKRSVSVDVPFSAVSTEQEFIIARLKAGDSIGELSFISGDPRSATIRCTTRCVLLSLHPRELTKLEVEFPAVANKMLKNLIGYVGERLRKTSANEVRALKTELGISVLNSKANLFFSYVICLLCVYNLTIYTITGLSLDTDRASIVSALIILVFCGVLALMIRQSKLPVHIFGLTTRNWKPAVRESMYWTTGIVAGMILIKWILIREVPKYHGLTLFSFDVASRPSLLFNFLLYGLHSPVQEFIARGVLQGSLQHFFKGRNVVLRAVLISNALFSATHVHLMHGLLGVIVFIPGLFWGWLYSRHENLIGVSISHIIVGWMALFFLDVQALF